MTATPTISGDCAGHLPCEAPIPAHLPGSLQETQITLTGQSLTIPPIAASPSANPYALYTSPRADATATASPTSAHPLPSDEPPLSQNADAPFIGSEGDPLLALASALVPSPLLERQHSPFLERSSHQRQTSPSYSLHPASQSAKPAEPRTRPNHEDHVDRSPLLPTTLEAPGLGIPGPPGPGQSDKAHAPPHRDTQHQKQRQQQHPVDPLGWSSGVEGGSGTAEVAGVGRVGAMEDSCHVGGVIPPSELSYGWPSMTSPRQTEMDALLPPVTAASVATVATAAAVMTSPTTDIMTSVTAPATTEAADVIMTSAGPFGMLPPTIDVPGPLLNSPTQMHPLVTERAAAATSATTASATLLPMAAPTQPLPYTSPAAAAATLTPNQYLPPHEAPVTTSPMMPPPPPPPRQTSGGSAVSPTVTVATTPTRSAVSPVASPVTLTAVRVVATCTTAVSPQRPNAAGDAATTGMTGPWVGNGNGPVVAATGSAGQPYGIAQFGSLAYNGRGGSVSPVGGLPLSGAVRPLGPPPVRAVSASYGVSAGAEGAAAAAATRPHRTTSQSLSGAGSGAAGGQTASGVTSGGRLARAVRRTCVQDMYRRSAVARHYGTLLAASEDALSRDPLLPELSRLTDDMLVPEPVLASVRHIRDVSNTTVNLSCPPQAPQPLSGFSPSAAAATRTTGVGGSILSGGGGGSSGAGGRATAAAAAAVSGGGVAGASGGQSDGWRCGMLNRWQLMSALQALSRPPSLEASERPGGGCDSRTATATAPPYTSSAAAGTGMAADVDACRTGSRRLVLLGLDLSGQPHLDDRVLEEGLLEGVVAAGRGGGGCRLKHLGLARCSLTSGCLLGLALCPPLQMSLRHLDLSYNVRLGWDEPGWRWALLGCSSLQVLDVRYTGFATAGLLALIDTLFDIQGIRRTLAVLQAGPPTNMMSTEHAVTTTVSPVAPPPAQPPTTTTAAARPNSGVPGAVETVMNAAVRTRSRSRCPLAAAAGGPPASEAEVLAETNGRKSSRWSYSWPLDESSMLLLTQRLAGMPALQVVELVGLSSGQVDEVFAALLARPTLGDKGGSAGRVEWVTDDCPRISLANGKGLHRSADRQLPPGVSVQRGLRPLPRWGSTLPHTLVEAGVGGGAGAGEVGGGIATANPEGRFQPQWQQQPSAEPMGVGAYGHANKGDGVGGGGVTGVVLQRQQQQQLQLQRFQQQQMMAMGMGKGSAGGGGGRGRKVQLGMEQFAMRGGQQPTTAAATAGRGGSSRRDAGGNPSGAAPFGIRSAPLQTANHPARDNRFTVYQQHAARQQRQSGASNPGGGGKHAHSTEEEEAWGLGGTDDDEERGSAAVRRGGGGRTSATQGVRRGSSVDAVAAWRRRRARQQQLRGPGGELRYGLHGGGGGGGANRTAAGGQSSPWRRTTHTDGPIDLTGGDDGYGSEYDDIFQEQPSRRRRQNQPNGSRSIGPSASGRSQQQHRRRGGTDIGRDGNGGAGGSRARTEIHNGGDDDDSDDDDDDLLYGRRGGRRADLYDSDGYRYDTDLDADLDGFIDEEVRLSTSEDDDDRLRGQAQRRAARFEQEELAREKAALLPALRRDHLRLTSPIRDNMTTARPDQSQSRSRSLMLSPRTRSPSPSRSLASVRRSSGHKRPRARTTGARHDRAARAASDGGGGGGTKRRRAGTRHSEGGGSLFRRPTDRPAGMASCPQTPGSSARAGAVLAEGVFLATRSRSTASGAGVGGSVGGIGDTPGGGGGSVQRTNRHAATAAAEALLDREQLLQNAARNPELRNLMPYAWDRRVGLHPVNLDHIYARGHRRRPKGATEEDEALFKPTGRYAGLVDQLNRQHSDDDSEPRDHSSDEDFRLTMTGGAGSDRDHGGGAGGRERGNGRTAHGERSTAAAAPQGAVTADSGGEFAGAAAAVSPGDVDMEDAFATTAAAAGVKPSARATRELRLLEPFGWDRRREKHPANLDLMGIPRLRETRAAVAAAAAAATAAAAARGWQQHEEAGGGAGPSISAVGAPELDNNDGSRLHNNRDNRLAEDSGTVSPVTVNGIATDPRLRDPRRQPYGAGIDISGATGADSGYVGPGKTPPDLVFGADAAAAAMAAAAAATPGAAAGVIEPTLSTAVPYVRATSPSAMTPAAQGAFLGAAVSGPSGSVVVGSVQEGDDELDADEMALAGGMRRRRGEGSSGRRRHRHVVLDGSEEQGLQLPPPPLAPLEGGPHDLVEQGPLAGRHPQHKEPQGKEQGQRQQTPQPDEFGDQVLRNLQQEAAALREALTALRAGGGVQAAAPYAPHEAAGGEEAAGATEAAELQRQLKAVEARIRRMQRELKAMKPWNWDEFKDVHPPNAEKLAPADAKRQRRAPQHYSPTKAAAEKQVLQRGNGGRTVGVTAEQIPVHGDAAVSPVAVNGIATDPRRQPYSAGIDTNSDDGGGQTARMAVSGASGGDPGYANPGTTPADVIFGAVAATAERAALVALGQQQRSTSGADGGVSYNAGVSPFAVTPSVQGGIIRGDGECRNYGDGAVAPVASIMSVISVASVSTAAGAGDDELDADEMALADGMRRRRGEGSSGRRRHRNVVLDGSEEQDLQLPPPPLVLTSPPLAPLEGGPHSFLAQAPHPGRDPQEKEPQEGPPHQEPQGKEQGDQLTDPQRPQQERPGKRRATSPLSRSPSPQQDLQQTEQLMQQQVEEVEKQQRQRTPQPDEFGDQVLRNLQQEAAALREALTALRAGGGVQAAAPYAPHEAAGGEEAAEATDEEAAELQRQLKAVEARIRRMERELKAMKPWNWDEYKDVHPPNVEKLAPAEAKRQRRAPQHYSPTKAAAERQFLRENRGGGDEWEPYDPAALSPVVPAAVRSGGGSPSPHRNRPEGHMKRRNVGASGDTRRQRNGQRATKRQRTPSGAVQQRMDGGSGGGSGNESGGSGTDSSDEDLPIGVIAAVVKPATTGTPSPFGASAATASPRLAAATTPIPRLRAGTQAGRAEARPTGRSLAEVPGVGVKSFARSPSPLSMPSTTTLAAAAGPSGPTSRTLHAAAGSSLPFFLTRPPPLTRSSPRQPRAAVGADNSARDRPGANDIGAPVYEPASECAVVVAESAASPVAGLQPLRRHIGAERPQVATKDQGSAEHGHSLGQQPSGTGLPILAASTARRKEVTATDGREQGERAVQAPRHAQGQCGDSRNPHSELRSMDDVGQAHSTADDTDVGRKRIDASETDVGRRPLETTGRCDVGRHSLGANGADMSRRHPVDMGPDVNGPDAGMQLAIARPSPPRQHAQTILPPQPPPQQPLLSDTVLQQQHIRIPLGNTPSDPRLTPVPQPSLLARGRHDRSSPQEGSTSTHGPVAPGEPTPLSVERRTIHKDTPEPRMPTGDEATGLTGPGMTMLAGPGVAMDLTEPSSMESTGPVAAPRGDLTSVLDLFAIGTPAASDSAQPIQNDGSHSQPGGRYGGHHRGPSPQAVDTPVQAQAPTAAAVRPPEGAQPPTSGHESTAGMRSFTTSLFATSRRNPATAAIGATLERVPASGKEDAADLRTENNSRGGVLPQQMALGEVAVGVGASVGAVARTTGAAVSLEAFNAGIGSSQRPARTVDWWMNLAGGGAGLGSPLSLTQQKAPARGVSSGGGFVSSGGAVGVVGGPSQEEILPASGSDESSVEDEEEIDVKVTQLMMQYRGSQAT